MCTFVSQFWVDENLFQIKYEVLAFRFEDSICWCFDCRAIEKKVGMGPAREIGALENEPIKQITFSKKRYEKDEKGKEVLIYCSPPPFYHRMKELLRHSGDWKPWYDDNPPIDDKDLFA